MKKKELLDYFGDGLLDSLYGFCYARVNDSYEAQELCSDIVLELVKAANTDGEIQSAYPFIWRVARNVYADFSAARRRGADMMYSGDPNEALALIEDRGGDDNSAELLEALWRRIAFLTKAYREVMIMFYIDGLSTAEIARRQHTSEGAVRQRLFSARQKLRNEVDEMEKSMDRECGKPVALEKLDFVLTGTGNPSWGDPRPFPVRMFSNHIIWLCREKPRTALEIARELDVPTLYVEQELEILARGDNGEYGLLRRLDGGRYAINFILFDRDEIERAQAICIEQLPMLVDVIADFIEAHRADYLAFPYLNHRVDMNLILWQQLFQIAGVFENKVENIMREQEFADVTEVSRPFSVYGNVDNGKAWGCGLDGVYAENVCGYSQVYAWNIYISRIQPHFHCAHNIATDPQLQLALRAISGLDIASLSEDGKEHAAKAVGCGYLYREGNMLYTKILACTVEDKGRLFKITNSLQDGYFEEEARSVAKRLAAFIRSAVPGHLIGEWRFANMLASMPFFDLAVDALIERGLLTPPENGVGAEGCWIAVGGK